VVSSVSVVTGPTDSGDEATAILINFPEVDAVVGPWRASMDPSASWGIPAHVTVMYPFIPAASITDGVVTRLRRIFRRYDPFDSTFDRCEWFADELLWLRPSHAEVFQRMTADVEEEFPTVRLYGGAFDEVIPHLTVGDARVATRPELAAAESAVAGALPVSEIADHALVMAGTQQPGSWRVLATLPFFGVGATG
jgi:hypothetical protein